MKALNLAGADLSPEQAAWALGISVAEVRASVRSERGLRAYQHRGSKRLRIRQSDLATYQAGR